MSWTYFVQHFFCVAVGRYNAPACQHTPDGFGTGLRAVIATEDAQTGALSFDQTKDVVIIKAQDDSFDAYVACLPKPLPDILSQ